MEITRTYNLLRMCCAGLAEGYLGSDDLNKEKFVPNFFLENPNKWQGDEERNLVSGHQKEPWRDFWKGPRDRLYRYTTVRKYLSKVHRKSDGLSRSGDLGRYTETGDVECTG